MVILRDEALDQADVSIAEAVAENLSVTVDDEGRETETFNWLALSRWANGRFGLNTNDRELKKIGRDDGRGATSANVPTKRSTAANWGRRSPTASPRTRRCGT